MKQGSWLTEISFLILAAVVGYAFYDGFFTVNAALHLVGLR